jgi:hypothetical protein
MGLPRSRDPFFDTALRGVKDQNLLRLAFLLLKAVSGLEPCGHPPIKRHRNKLKPRFKGNRPDLHPMICHDSKDAIYPEINPEFRHNSEISG